MLSNCGAEEDYWESLGCKEIKSVCPKGNNPEYSLERLMLKLKLQYFGHLIWRAYSSEKDPDVGTDWWQKEKRAAEDEIIKQHNWLSGNEFEQTLGKIEGQGNLACCSPWGHKEWHDLETEQQDSREETFLAFSSFWELLGILDICWFLNEWFQSLPLFSHWFLPCVSVCLTVSLSFQWYLSLDLRSTIQPNKKNFPGGSPIKNLPSMQQM